MRPKEAVRAEHDARAKDRSDSAVTYSLVPKVELCAWQRHGPKKNMGAKP